MCGLAGWIDWVTDIRQDRVTLEAMSQRLAARGPDEEGMWVRPEAGLVHRRLVVIDPEGGKQPMTREERGQTYVLVYNGELYNTPELRSELEGRGYRFRTRSDTEVLLVSYIEWGVECVQRLNGIYAFGVWNDTEQSLFLARDRLGVKPLFFTERGSSFIFGSELKALLVHPAVPAEVDAIGLAEIFGLGPARTPGVGVYRGIQEVKPAEWLLYDRQGIRRHKYWMMQSRPHEDGQDVEETARRVRFLLEDAAHRQLVSDVPVCTFLSGGLDSSAITAFAVKGFREHGHEGTTHTYSIDYKDNDKHFQANDFQPNADTPWARRVSEHLGTTHHWIEVDTPQLVGALEAAVRARDLPGMADVDSSLYLFCQQVKKGATVAVSGECADEIFGGYPWFHRDELINADTFPWSRSLEQRKSWIAPDLLEKLDLDEYVAARYEETLTEVSQSPEDSPVEARRREIGYLTMQWFMQTLLDRKDRMSMAWGLEVRVPFCDHHLVEYVWNIPWELKTAGNMAKGILRRALTGLLPEGVLQRRKSPYPKTHNPNYLEAVSKKLLGILDDPSSPLLSLINADEIRKMIQLDDDPYNAPWFGQLMTGPQLFAYLIQMDFWLREYGVEIVGV